MQYFTKQDIKNLERCLQIKKEASSYEEKLWKKVHIYKNILSFIPGVSCVCICNSLAMNACHSNSDIDLFIITQRNRLWSVRIFLTSFFALFGQRKTSKKHAGKFCLSFFISETAPSFETFAIPQDVYLAHWIETLVPIVNKNQSFERFQANNIWYEIEGLQKKDMHLLKKEYPVQKWVFIWDVLEKILKSIFLPRTKKSSQKLWEPFGIIISDTILKFHNDDQREAISQKVFE